MENQLPEDQGPASRHQAFHLGSETVDCFGEREEHLHMSACDFCLCRYLKEKVYRPMPTVMTQLKQRISGDMALISPEMVKEARLCIPLRREQENLCSVGERLLSRNTGSG